MKKDLLLKTLLVASLATSAIASDIDGMQDVSSDPYENTEEGSSALDMKEHFQVRLGFGIGGGTFYLEDDYGNKSRDLKIESASNFEISFVAGREYKKGLDYRSALTLQFNKWKAEDASEEVSDIMFLGEGEIAYNVNQLLSPFIGWYGGIGTTNADSYNSSQLTYDLGLFAGVSGELKNGLGYYAKYNFKSWKGFNVDDDTLGVRMSPTTLRIGASYTF